MISLLSFVATALLVTRALRPRARTEAILVFTVVITLAIVLPGYLLSAMQCVNAPAAWTVVSLLLLGIIAGITYTHRGLRALCWRKIAWPREVISALRQEAAPRFATVMTVLLLGTLLPALIARLVVLLGLPPATRDVLDYHLARVAYYLQSGSIAHFTANYWAQNLHPKIASLLMLYTYLATGEMLNRTQLVQFAAYLVSMTAVYGIARRLGAARLNSLATACVFGLLAICLAEAVTAQNDLVVTAFFGIAVYGLLAYRAERNATWLVLASLALALAAGVKSTAFSFLPSLAIIAWFALKPRINEQYARAIRPLALGVMALVLGGLLLTLPAGYAENIKYFHHPIGPASVRAQHSFDGQPLPQVLGYGTLNLLRYAMDFLAFDGMWDVPVVRQARQMLTAPPRMALETLGIDLEAMAGSRVGFHYDRSSILSENFSFWGVLGFTLVWPAVILALVFRRRRPELAVFALAALVFLLVQAYISPYDFWRGRYFTTGALFAVPVVSAILCPRSRIGQAYVALALVLGCMSALMGVTISTDTVLFSRRNIPSTLTADADPLLTYCRQATRQCPELLQPLLTFERLVPPRATVAIYTDRACPDLLFFGPGLTRRIYPVRPLIENRLPLPDADYLLYTAGTLPPRDGDVRLEPPHRDYGLFCLRRLK